MSELADIRRRVAEACRVLGVLELTLNTLGHASARLPGSDRILIRGRGPAESGVRYTSADDIIEIDLNGKRVEGLPGDGYAAPIEVYIHTEIYRRRPEVNSIIHVHPTMAVLLSICNKPLLPIYGAFDPHGLMLALSGVPIFDKSILIRTPELGEELADTIGKSEACIMRGHGITTAANSVEEAALLAIHLNTLATMTYQANLLGGVTPIASEEQDEFRSLVDSSYGQPRVGFPSGRSESLWRYYVRFADEKK